MNEHPLTHTLNHLAEKGIPGDLDLRTAIHRRLEMGKTPTGVFPMKTSFAQNRIWRMAAPTAIVTLLLAAALLLTPQGRALAENALQFFNRVQAPDRPEFTEEPVRLYDVSPNLPPPTATPQPHEAFYETCGGWPEPTCTIEQIRALVSFPVKELSLLPDNVLFIGATGDPNSVSLKYDSADHTGGLIVQTLPWQEVQALQISISTTVETIQIGAQTGEYVRGMWASNGPQSAWNANDDLYTLRWREGDWLVQIMAFGTLTINGQPLDKDGMAALANSLTLEPVALLQPAPLANSPLTIETAKELAGFALVQPHELPDGVHFDHVAYEPEKNSICLYYQGYGTDGSTAHMILAQMPAPGPQANDLIDYATYDELNVKPENITFITSTLTVGGAIGNLGQYVYTGINEKFLCGSKTDEYTNYNQALIWQVNDRAFVMMTTVSLGLGEGIDSSSEMGWTKQKMVLVAESITGVHTVAADAPDPEHLLSVADAQSLIGFGLIEPTRLPAGAAFTYAQYGRDADRQWVTLNYGTIWITQSSGPAPNVGGPTFEELPEGYIQLTIHGQPALYWRGGCWKQPNGGGFDPECGAPTSITWTENGIEYTVGAFDAAPLETLSEIAESLR
jgi:hypothetical protein